jgi:ribosomal-protein-alanine N-acetyltransferase
MNIIIEGKGNIMATFDFHKFPVLTTDRLVLRQIVPADAPDIFSLRTDSEVQQWMASEMRLVKDIAEIYDWIKTTETQYASHEGLYWGIHVHTEDRLCGVFSLGIFDRMHFASLAYELARSHQGQGYASEAVRAIVRFCFENIHIHRLGVSTLASNMASLRLMSSVGIPSEGVIRDCVLNPDGTYQSWAQFGLLEQEYPQWLVSQEQNVHKKPFSGNIK